MVDTHCHLDSCKPPDAELVERARAAGVTRLATVGMHDESIERALGAAREFDEVVAIVGRHPHYTEGFGDADLERIERAAADPRARAIGETGLDYFRDRAPREDQRRAFEAQIDLAERSGLALVIHTREAEEDTFALLGDRAGGVTVILHCFSAPGRIDECVERGYMCSFAGNVTYPKATELREAAVRVPRERILAETDSPYLAPQPVRGKRNEPAHVVHTVAALAAARGEDAAELGRQIDANATTAFGLAT